MKNAVSASSYRSSVQSSVVPSSIASLPLPLPLAELVYLGPPKIYSKPSTLLPYGGTLVVSRTWLSRTLGPGESTYSHSFSRLNPSVLLLFSSRPLNSTTDTASALKIEGLGVAIPLLSDSLTILYKIFSALILI